MKYREQLPAILRYFQSNSDAQTAILRTLSQGNGVSLRLLDWFVTYYCRNHPVFLNDGSGVVCVYAEYKNNLKAYSKRGFDPFCRRERISINEKFETDPAGSVCTTVGQLAFFRWAIQCGVLEYCERNVVELETRLAEWASTAKAAKGTSVGVGFCSHSAASVAFC